MNDRLAKLREWLLADVWFGDLIRLVALMPKIVLMLWIEVLNMYQTESRKPDSKK